MRRFTQLNVKNKNGSDSLFTFTDPDSNSDLESDPIPVVGSYVWNLNLTPCSVESS